jgi:hypothetical protein
MPRCARRTCGRWRPGLLVRIAGLGVRLDEAWYCSVRCLEVIARERLAGGSPVAPRALPPLAQSRLGGMLATQKRLTRDVVEQAASEQAGSGLRIGMQLVKLGVVTQFDVLRALAAQGGIGFLTAVDVARVRMAPGNLSPHIVRALGLVPFEVDRRHDVLKVACTAPVPRSAVAALRELTGSIIEPYLVADEQWPALAQAYGSAPRHEGPRFSALADVGAAAEHVAAAARQAGGVRLSHARCYDHLWLRIEAGGRLEECWLPVEPAPAESAGLAGAGAGAAAAVAAAPAPVRPRRVRGAKAAARPAGRRHPAAVPPDPPATTGGAAADLSFLQTWGAGHAPLVQR